MNALRVIGGIVAAILLALLIWAWFLPSVFKSENAIIINAPLEDVFDHVVDMNTWEDWQILDTNITNKVEKRDGVADSIVWTGQAGVQGSIVIDSIVPEEYIRFIYRYHNQPDDFQYGHMYFDRSPEGTKVLWKHENDVGWNPILRFALNFTDDWKKLFDDTLLQLKEDIESRKKEPAAGDGEMLG